MAPPPQAFPSSSPSIPMPPAAPPGSFGPGCFPAPPASMNTPMGSAAPGPWWCGPPVPQQAMPWWPAPSCGKQAVREQPSSQPVQKDDINSDPKEWGVDDVLQQLTKLQGTNESREKMLETRKHVSSEKLKSARLNHLAAKENAKSAMLETYRALSMKDTSAMADDVRVEHLAFMRCVRESIFGKTELDANGSS